MTTSEATQAAWCELRHGDPRESDQVRRARKGMSDLIGRTWKAGHDALSRDERRLMQKYRATLDAASQERVAAYRRCVECNPGSTTDEGQGS